LRGQLVKSIEENAKLEHEKLEKNKLAAKQ
jgi:hypothetical protein